ncbi:MAG: HigA family addiction module antitoxin [Betaproteobacteria bacterium]|nr:HigA family addiction module antitoxin [Betaproteobacteria bacterium]
MTIRIEDLRDLDFSDVAELPTGRTAPIHPGEVLQNEFLKPLGVSQYALAKAIGVPPRRINEIVHGTRGITVNTALRLARFFCTDAQSWINLQTHHDTIITEEKMRDVLMSIPRHAKLHAA